MAVVAVVGAQWGDEGKGKVVDFLASQADMVIRFQGGANAGHTIVNDIGEFKLHGVPSGIFRPNVVNLIGSGTVAAPDDLLQEIELLKRKNVSLENLRISDRTHVVMPYHYDLERLEESLMGDRRIGTTNKAIGPTYADKYGRFGIRMSDLADPAWLSERLSLILRYKNTILKAFGLKEYELGPLVETCRRWHRVLEPYLCNSTPLVDDAIRSGKRILLEGQLGVGKCVEWGSYPYVTSSSPTAGYASVGAGIPPHRITEVVGVVKAYSTSVGAGPMVTEDSTGPGLRIREVGHEYGATTGRPRRCGWLDGVMLRQSSCINGYTSVAVTRLDVLDTFETIGICTAYEYAGERITDMPATPVVEHCRPVYEYLPGWNRSLRNIRKLEDLPGEARRYLDRIVEWIRAPLKIVSVGPRREETIVV